MKSLIAGLNFFKNLVVCRHMIFTMAKQDFKTKYVESFLGIFWNIFHPMLNILLYYFIFAVIFAIKSGSQYRGVAFLPWFLIGFIVWQLFAETVLCNLGIIVNNANLITKNIFPSEILPISTFMSNALSHFIYLLITLIVTFCFKFSFNEWMLMKLAYFLFLSFLFTTGLSWLLASLNVFIRDIQQIFSVFLNLWFYLTPIFIPVQLVEEKLGLMAGRILRCNPIFFLVEGYRDAILGGSVLGYNDYIVAFMISAAMFIVGGLVFRMTKPVFADVL